MAHSFAQLRLHIPCDERYADHKPVGTAMKESHKNQRAYYMRSNFHGNDIKLFLFICRVTFLTTAGLMRSTSSEDHIPQQIRYNGPSLRHHTYKVSLSFHLIDFAFVLSLPMFELRLFVSRANAVVPRFCSNTYGLQ